MKNGINLSGFVNLQDNQIIKKVPYIIQKDLKTKQ